MTKIYNQDRKNIQNLKKLQKAIDFYSKNHYNTCNTCKSMYQWEDAS